MSARTPASRRLSCQAGPGHVLAPVDLDVAALVRPHGHPPHGVEGHARQRPHLRQVLAQRLAAGPAVAAPRRRVEAGAALREAPVELGHRTEGRHRHEQVAPQEAHRVLDGALLVARVGVAVARLEPVVALELGEQGRLGHLAAHHPAGLGGVVEHHQPGRAAPAPEDLGQAGAHALRPLGPGRHALPVVGVGQRRHQQLQLERLAGDGRPEVAVVDLAGARPPLQLQVALPGPGRARQPPVPHEAPHRRVRPLEAALLDQPVVYAPGRVALLARGPRVGLEDRLDPGPVALQGRPLPGRGHGGGRRHVLHVGVLGDGVAAQPEPPGDLSPRDAVGVHRAYLVSCVLGHGHLLHPSRRALLENGARETIRRGPPPALRGAALVPRLLSFQ